MRISETTEPQLLLSLQRQLLLLYEKAILPASGVVGYRGYNCWYTDAILIMQGYSIIFVWDNACIIDTCLRYDLLLFRLIVVDNAT